MTSDENTASVHLCKRGRGRGIPERYAFSVCVRCSLDELERDPDIVSWRQAKKTAAYERLRAAGLVK